MIKDTVKQKVGRGLTPHGFPKSLTSSRDGAHSAAMSPESKDGHATPQRRARFSSTTKGIRLLPDQIKFINEEIANDAEQTWSRIVREGIKLVMLKRKGLIQELAPVPPRR